MATILVVDDEEMIRTNLEAFLEDEGFSVLVCETGEKAQEIFRSHPVDLAIIDIRLPGIDGDKVISQALHLYPHVRFLIHTGSSEYSLPPALQEQGLTESNILHKPITDMQILKNTIIKLLQS